MAVSDLTNTVWAIKETPVVEDYAEYSINFTSNNTNCERLVLAKDYLVIGDGPAISIGYISNGSGYSAYNSDYGGWPSQAYRIISITGGTDATNATLIAWLEANATQVPVTDLSGTEWVINSTTCSAGYGQFSINYKIAEGISEQNYELSIGYYYSFDLDIFVAAVNNVWVDRYISLEIDNIVEITDGTDATNPDLIAWLSQNATLQQPTPSTTNNIFFGTSSINKVYFGTSEVSKIYYGNTLIYEMSGDVPDNTILDCNGNVIKASDGYLITTELSLYPVKGDVINIGSNTDDFRIMNIQGSTALLLNLTTSVNSAYNTNSTTTTFDNGTTAQQYEGSTIDLAMSDYYDNLDSDIKNAIIPTSIKQSAVHLSETDPDINNDEWVTTGRNIVYDDEITINSRNCFILDIKDIENYFDSENIDYTDLDSLTTATRMIFRTAHSTYQFSLIQSSVGDIDKNLIFFSINCSTAYDYYPSFYIDLSNVTYDYSYKTLTLKLANCSTTQNPITSRTGVNDACIITPNQNYGIFACSTSDNNIKYLPSQSNQCDYLYNSQTENYEINYELFFNEVLYVPMFEYYKIKFNNNNTYLEKDVTNVSNNVSITFDNIGLPNTAAVTIDGIAFTPLYKNLIMGSTTHYYHMSITTTNYFWSKDDIVISGCTGNIFITDNKTISIDITSCTSSTPSITVNSHTTQYNFKNKTIVLPLLSTESPKAWIGSYNGRGFNFDKYTPSGLGFTSNGTHFIGFYSDNDNSGGGTAKNPSSYWYYVNDNNERVKICTKTSVGTATWESDAYKTLKFDNVNYYDNDLWEMLFIANGATEQ